jgi:hypothetical protein
MVSTDELASLRRDADIEVAEPGRWGTTFTLIQSWEKLDGGSRRSETQIVLLRQSRDVPVQNTSR